MGRPIGKGNEDTSFFFEIRRGKFLSAKRVLSRRWKRRHWRPHWRRYKGRTTTTTTTTSTTTRGGSEAVRNAGRRPDRSQAAGVVRRADAESPKVAAVRRVAAARVAAARVAAAPGVARNVAAAKAAVPSRRLASGRIRERPTASKLIPALLFSAMTNHKG